MIYKLSLCVSHWCDASRFLEVVLVSDSRTQGLLGTAHRQ